ncbi:MAG: hypothetical protein CL912_20755 [Deltaproteobacteria bacterium]|nr:hypothetical protein [Deltaproteobacteria bacterium]
MVDAAEAGCELCCLLLKETGNSGTGFESTFDLEKTPIFARVVHDLNGDLRVVASRILFYQSEPEDSLDLQAFGTSLGIYVYPVKLRYAIDSADANLG